MRGVVTDPIVEQALHRSVLSALPRDQLDKLVSDSLRIDIPAGSTVYREGDPPRCGLLLSGLARVFLVSPDGRQATIRYMRPGSLSGASLVIRGISAGARVQAVTDIVGILLNCEVVEGLGRTDARF